jgi:hypothetical protein
MKTGEKLFGPDLLSLPSPERFRIPEHTPITVRKRDPSCGAWDEVRLRRSNDGRVSLSLCNHLREKRGFEVDLEEEVVRPERGAVVFGVPPEFVYSELNLASKILDAGKRGQRHQGGMARARHACCLLCLRLDADGSSVRFRHRVLALSDEHQATATTWVPESAVGNELRQPTIDGRLHRRVKQPFLARKCAPLQARK